MGQITYQYPAMLGTAGEMQGYGAAIQAMGDAISSEQGVLAGAWNGDTGGSFQVWQNQWNSALAQLVMAYKAMTDSHENNTMTMAARDAAEGAKWGG
jgi:WXG100 family type VII secretion target